jgi:hypothetical protein
MDGSIQLNFQDQLKSADVHAPADRRSYVVRLPATPVGVALFDSNGLSDAGWACVAGEAPFRIKSGFSLATDTIWWSNLDNKMLAGRVPKSVRGSDYLKTPISLAIRELGLDGLADDQMAEQLAFHFGVVARLLEKLAKRPLSQFAHSKSLHYDILDLTGPAPVLSNDVASRIFASGKNWLWTKVEDASYADTICFREPRLSYGLSLLETPVPAQAVTWRQKPEVDPLESIRNTLAPVYAELSVKNAMAKPAQLFGLANTGSGKLTIGAALVSHPELLALEAFAELNVTGVWKGRDYKEASSTMPPHIVEFLNSKSALFSWSAGIIAYALIHGMCSTSVSRKGEKELSFRGVWLRAADKVTMFANAMGFHKAGFRPTSYGLGWIRVLRPDTAKANAGLLAVALRRGLLPDPHALDPEIIADVANGTYGPPNPDNGWKNGAFQAALFLHNEQRYASEFDDMPLKSAEGRKKAEEAVRAIFKKR